MLITKTNPVGIDNAIQKLQTQIHTTLVTKWGLGSEEENKLYQCYGRCYRNKKDNGYIAEIFTGGIDYRDAYWDDSLKALSFFGVSDRIEEEIGKAKADVHLVFFVNLAKLKPSISHRADEEVRQDVINAIGRYSYGFDYTGYETSLENVLREYPGSRREEGLKAVDMQPVHCFRINLKVSYNPNKNC
jgi:hypothetical protein